MTMRPAAAMMNGAAGRGAAPRLSVQIEGALNAAEQTCTFIDGASPRQIADQIGSWDGPPATLVAAGGDGTVNLAVNALADFPECALAVAPVGSGNDLSRAMGYDPRKDAVDQLSEALKTQPIKADVLTVREGTGKVRKALGIVSAGFDARVNHRANSMRFPPGPAKYLRALLQELRGLDPLLYQVDIDGQPPRYISALLIAVANVATLGGGMKLAPKASLTSGDALLVIVHPVSRATLVRLLPSLYKGTHVKHPAVEIVRIKSVRIARAGGGSHPVFADGESFGSLPVEVTVNPAAQLVHALPGKTP